MTIVNANQKLFEYLKTNDSVYLSNTKKKDDFLKIVTLSDSEERDRVALLLSLRGFEERGILKKSDNEELWILVKPLESYEQQITLDYDSVASISGIINKFCESNANKTDVCDILDIRQKDIKNLILITLHFIDRVNSQKPDQNSVDEE